MAGETGPSWKHQLTEYVFNKIKKYNCGGCGNIKLSIWAGHGHGHGGSEIFYQPQSPIILWISSLFVLYLPLFI